MSRWAKQDYDFWLARLRTGHDAFIAEQELDGDEDDRKLVAANILIAFDHLTDRESPYKDNLTEDDLRIVAMARGINDKPRGGWVS